MSQNYDSAARTRIFRDTFLALWKHRDLIQILVKRDIAVQEILARLTLDTT